PVRVFALCTAHVDNFIAARRKEPGLRKGDLVSPSSVNADLRQIKAAFRKAKKWGYINAVPDFDMLKVPKKLPTYVTPEHFAAIYKAGETAGMPEASPSPAADWWRGLIVMAYMTGWRISALLASRRDDLDLTAGTAVTLAEDNKGDRDARVRLHPAVLEHLRRLACFHPCVFPWNHNRRTLDDEWHRIQRRAVVKNERGEDVPLRLPCRKNHEHIEACFCYGFHDLRRAFATMNADRLTPDALQSLMRHKSYQTTQVYVNMTRQLDDAVASLHVPDVLKKGAVMG